MKIVDLFCGCGGFSLGAHLAGFETALAVDIDPILSSSYTKNFPSSKLVNADLSKIDLKDHLGEEKIAGIIGGPPCQGFSLMGRREKNDPRNKLVSHFFRHVLALKPAFFIMENVPGILSGDSYKTLNSALKAVQKEYTIVGPIKVNAADFGAATRRSRILVLGFDATQMQPLSEDEIKALRTSKLSNVRDAISDLPSPIDGIKDENSFEWVPYKAGKTDYAKKASKLPPKGLGYAPAVKKLKEGMVSGLLSTVHTAQIKKRYKALKQGATDPISRATRLDWDQLCSTLRAGTGSDKGSYQAVRPIHPDQARVITVREAARLQGFPDWFIFHPTKWHSFRMIGNSVSPYLSEAIMKVIAKKLLREEVLNKSAA